MSLNETLARGLTMIKAIHSWRLTLLGVMDGQGYNWKTSYTLKTFTDRFRSGEIKVRGAAQLAAVMHRSGVPESDYWMYAQLQGESIFHRPGPAMWPGMQAELKGWMTRPVFPMTSSELTPNGLGSFNFLLEAQMKPLEVAMVIEASCRQHQVDLWDVLPRAVDPDRFPFKTQWPAVLPYRALAVELTNRREQCQIG